MLGVGKVEEACVERVADCFEQAEERAGCNSWQDDQHAH